MNIKKLVKLFFIIIVVLFLIISSINYLVFEQLRENSITKNHISQLVSLQENMNLLLKDAKNSKILLNLQKIQKHFFKYEAEFEKVKDILLNFEHNDFLDLITDDIHKDKDVQECISKLLKNEHKIELAFDKIFKMQSEYISLMKQVKVKYKKEESTRDKMEQNIMKSQDLFLIHHFGNMKYYSKEALFQYKDKKSLNNWLNEMSLLQSRLPKKNIEHYKRVIKDLGSDVIRLSDIEKSIEILKNEIQIILAQNRKVNDTITKSIERISDNFFDFTYKFMIYLRILLLIIILFIGYKVNKSVGLSVDEIEQKIQDGIKEIKKLDKEIEDTQKEVVFTMGAIGERRSKETGNHVKRVAAYSKLLALKYGLDEKEAEMLKQASPMHDIGKVAIPDSILNKPGRFTPGEREIMETHAELGYDMLKSSSRPLLKTAAIVAYQHHEKWDGTGYPNKLKGEDIHIYGRITAVADVFDALGSDRVYKKAWEDERIFKLFKEERGKQFDPKLVDIFFENLDQFLKIRDSFKDV